MKNLTKMLLALTFSVALVGCGKDDTTASSTDEPIVLDQLEQSTDVAEEETPDVDLDLVPEGMYRSELTNELLDISLMNQRPIAAMVDNEYTALPHYGLSKADIVYEMMNSTLNGRVTRFMALVKDWESIERLGSIRSVRPTNCLLAAGWNAILCHDGGPFYVDDYLAQDYSDNFSGTFSRIDNGKAREFTEYIVAGDLESNFSNYSGVSQEYTGTYVGPHFKFAPPSTPVEFLETDFPIAASEVILPFEHNSSMLEYNKENGLYEYSEYGEPHLDPGNDNAQLAFKNVIIQECSFSQLDENGYMIFNVLGHGNLGYYITEGQAIRINWVKNSPESPTLYYNYNTGEEITLNTGKTYISLVPSDNWSQLIVQ